MSGVLLLLAMSVLFAAPPANAQVADNPALQQQVWKALVAKNLRLFTAQFKGTMFGDAVNLGNPMVLHRRLMEEDLDLVVDPAKLEKEDADALFMLWDHDIIVKASLEFYPVSVVGRSTDKYFSFMDVWHELHHAVMHEMEHESMAARVAALSEKDDEVYIEWAEDAVTGLDSAMRKFEQYMKANGKVPSSNNVAARGRKGWVKFCTMIATPRGAERRLPTDAEKEEFKRVFGFDVNPSKIKAHYLSLGYSPLYFDEAAKTNALVTDGPRILDGLWSYGGNNYAEARHEDSGDWVFKTTPTTLTVEWWVSFDIHYPMGNKPSRVETYDLMCTPEGLTATCKSKDGKSRSVIEAKWKGKDLEGRFYGHQEGKPPDPEGITLFTAFRVSDYPPPGK